MDENMSRILRRSIFAGYNANVITEEEHFQALDYLAECEQDQNNGN